MDVLQNLKMHGACQAMVNLKPTQESEKLLLHILQAELEYKKQRASQRRTTKAQFPVTKEWSDLDLTVNSSIEFDKIRELGNNGEFIEERKNLCLMGQPGTGKTHTLIALGRQLCRKGMNVRFITACALVNALEDAKMKHELSKCMQQFTNPDLLIIDELGFVPFSENGARLLFDVFSSRYERGSIAISTNLSYEKWIQIFGSMDLTAALIDRFTHKCLIYTYQGESYRFLEAARKKKRGGKSS